jgi:hypothetical protein
MKKILQALIIVVAIAGIAYYLSSIFRTSTQSKTPVVMTSMQGMNMGGDADKRYTVSFTTEPQKVVPNQDTILRFKIYDAASGNEVTDYSLVMEKLMHLVIVDSQLQYFTHIHPIHNNSEFTVTTQFPHEGIYHLYSNFLPTNATEQQFAFSVVVGNGKSSTGAATSSSISLATTVENYKITLSAPAATGFHAKDMSNGAQLLNFHFTNAATGEAITNLAPYLGAFGHMVMINQETYRYLHVHPILSDTGDFGGPDVQFLPVSLYDKIEPGTYRVFLQFNVSSKLLVADFTIKVD